MPWTLSTSDAWRLIVCHPYVVCALTIPPAPSVCGRLQCAPKVWNSCPACLFPSVVKRWENRLEEPLSVHPMAAPPHPQNESAPPVSGRRAIFLLVARAGLMKPPADAAKHIDKLWDSYLDKLPDPTRGEGVEFEDEPLT